MTRSPVRSVHFNDPVDDGIPDLHGHETSATLAAARALIHEAGIAVVLESDRTTFDRPEELQRGVESVGEWLEEGM